MEIVCAPDNKLRVKTKEVKKITPALKNITSKMINLTESFTDPEGVGLASTQIGASERFFIAKMGKKFITCFNPKILSKSLKTKEFFEGCLSIPNIYGEIKRPIGVKVSYQDETGKVVKKSLSGLSAWIFQHEVDHLDGILFMDKVLSQKGRVFKAVGKDRTGADIFEEMKI